jgi:hypothetical protein
VRLFQVWFLWRLGLLAGGGEGRSGELPSVGTMAFLFDYSRLLMSVSTFQDN